MLLRFITGQTVMPVVYGRVRYGFLPCNSYFLMYRFLNIYPSMTLVPGIVLLKMKAGQQYDLRNTS